MVGVEGSLVHDGSHGLASEISDYHQAAGPHSLMPTNPLGYGRSRGVSRTRRLPQVSSETPGCRRVAGRQIANTYDKPSGAEFNRREKGDILVFPIGIPYSLPTGHQ